MFTNRKEASHAVASTRYACARHTAMLVLLGGSLLVIPAQAQQIIETKVWSEDQRIDETLGTLKGPALQPLPSPPGSREDTATVIPLYKQQPPAAQGDFRSK